MADKFDTVAAQCKATNRQQAIDADDVIRKPAVARANVAVSTDHPEGIETYTEQFEDYVSTAPAAPMHSANPCCTDGAATTCPLLGPRLRRPDLPLAYV